MILKWNLKECNGMCVTFIFPYSGKNGGDL